LFAGTESPDSGAVAVNVTCSASGTLYEKFTFVDVPGAIVVLCAPTTPDVNPATADNVTCADSTQFPAFVTVTGTFTVLKIFSVSEDGREMTMLWFVHPPAVVVVVAAVVVVVVVPPAVVVVVAPVVVVPPAVVVVVAPVVVVVPPAVVVVVAPVVVVVAPVVVVVAAVVVVVVVPPPPLTVKCPCISDGPWISQ
jgi:hypothetical protein